MWNSDKFTRRGNRLWIIPLVLLATSYSPANAHVSLGPNKFLTSKLQQQTVSGVVRDAGNNQPMGGVTISVKGTSVATQTDDNGNFSIEASTGQVIVANFLGYQSQEKTVSSGTMNFSLQSSDQQIEELVVVGYGTMRKIRCNWFYLQCKRRGHDQGSILQSFRKLKG
jgi:hypothetical protein